MSFLKNFLNTLSPKCKQEVKSLLSKDLLDLPVSYFEKQGCKLSSCRNCKNTECKIQTGQISGDVTNLEFIRHFISSLSDESKNEVRNRLKKLCVYLNSTRNNILTALLLQDFIWPKSYIDIKKCKNCNPTLCEKDNCLVKQGKITGNATNQDFFVSFLTKIPINFAKKMNSLINTSH